LRCIERTRRRHSGRRSVACDVGYGADAQESFDRAAALAASIFKGANPADLPFELPTRYLFVLNLKTAKAINLTVSNNLLAMADEVIE
jgi:putative tryptophan/tyrosine transport system substrate-binding protein